MSNNTVAVVVSALCLLGVAVVLAPDSAPAPAVAQPEPVDVASAITTRYDRTQPPVPLELCDALLLKGLGDEPVKGLYSSHVAAGATACYLSHMVPRPTP